MNVKSFLKLVEIQTKLASMLPFMLGTIYAWLRFDSFRPINFLLMFISLLCIDMTTTAVNNYMDYKKAVKKEGFGYETHNAIVRDKLTGGQVITAITVMLLIAAVSGIILVLRTDLLVLVLGAVSVAAGILYSAGPVPISRTPFGEVFSGGFMGLLIPFIAIYIQTPAGEILNWSVSVSAISLELKWQELLWIFLISWPAASGIANIMLANNICDLDDDIANKRYTIVSYIGKKQALILFRALCYSGYLTVVAAAFAGVINWLALIVFLATIIPVERKLRIFAAKQVKAETFVIAVQNFTVMTAALILTVLLSTVINLLI